MNPVTLKITDMGCARCVARGNQGPAGRCRRGEGLGEPGARAGAGLGASRMPRR
jgi:hypothetical protein